MSISTTSAPRALPEATASKATAPGSAPGPWRTSWAPERSAHTASWSIAAARKVSAAPITTLWSSSASR